MELKQMKEALQKLQMEQFAYNHAICCLYFDGLTIAPRGAAEARGTTLGLLSEKTYSLLVNDDTRALLDGLWDKKDELDAVTRRQCEILRENLDELTRIPMEEYAAYQRLTSEAGEKWRTAKENNDYALFKPCLKQVLDYQKRFAAYKNAAAPAYDVMLDNHEKGMTMEKLDPFFAMLREKIVPLVERTKSQPAAPAFLTAACSIEKQRELSNYLMELMGVDRRCCALAETEHPFTIGACKYDERITTHYHENAFLSSMYSVIHESGHALYDMGVADEYQYTALADGASMGIHESQSRFYENMIGHNPLFLRFLAPKLREYFPDVLGQVDDSTLISAVNRVEPSLIRTEADEVTYPLHIMVRYEIEKRLVGGELTVDELPEAWNAMYKEYLGVTVPNDTMGVLQDMHWSDGSFGYFPSYALGSAYAAQFMNAMRRDLDVDALLSAGNLKPIREWLRTHVHTHGSLYKPAELIEKTTGEKFNPAYYVEHLMSAHAALTEGN